MSQGTCQTPNFSLTGVALLNMNHHGNTTYSKTFHEIYHYFCAAFVELWITVSLSSVYTYFE